MSAVERAPVGIKSEFIEPNVPSTLIERATAALHVVRSDAW
jgi:hypothetical protein